MNRALAYTLSFIIILLTAVSGSLFTYSNVQSDWYRCVQPQFTPPKQVFPIVWTLLYILIAISLGNIFSNDESFENTLLLSAFFVNLVFNTVWCYFYFSKRDVLLALITIVSLALTIGVIVVECDDTFVRYSMLAYFLWITFATLLNTITLFNVQRCSHLQSNVRK